MAFLVVGFVHYEKRFQIVPFILFPVKGGYEMFRLTFDVTQIEVLHDRLKSNSVRIEELRDRDSCGINFVFFDPDGNKFDVNEVVWVSRTPEEAKKLREHLFSVV
jgi:hypothetical protein